jgi:cytoskeletal protein CcmA (bactofilin family)
MVAANFAVLGLTSGDVTVMDVVSITGDLDVPAGSTFKTEADANTTFGGSVTGKGALNIGGKLTTLNAVSVSTVDVIVGVVNFGGSVTSDTVKIFAGTTTFGGASTVNNFAVISGNVAFTNSVSASNVTVEGGILTGAGGFSASSAASFASQGINLGTTFSLSGSMSFAEKTLIAYAVGGAISISSAGTVSVSSPLTLTGAPGAGSFSNDGSVSISGALSSANINLLGSGSYSVAGSITTSSCDFSAGTVNINGGTVSGQTTKLNIGSVATSSGDVTVKIGNYTFACPGQCKDVSSASSGQPYSFTA